MKIIVYFLLVLFISGCSLFVSNENFDYFENDIADFYIPKNYKYIEVNKSLSHPYYTPIFVNESDKNYNIKDADFIANIVFYYADSSYFFLGRNHYGNLKVTELCCDTVFTEELKIQYYSTGKIIFKPIRGENFPRAEDYDSDYYLEPKGTLFTDWVFDKRDSTYRKQIMKNSTFLDIYYSAGYVCKNPQDTIKFNKALEMINWKY
jgi:hypothetical protein